MASHKSLSRIQSDGRRKSLFSNMMQTSLLTKPKRLSAGGAAGGGGGGGAAAGAGGGAAVASCAAFKGNKPVTFSLNKQKHYHVVGWTNLSRNSHIVM